MTKKQMKMRLENSYWHSVNSLEMLWGKQVANEIRNGYPNDWPEVIAYAARDLSNEMRRATKSAGKKK